MLVLLYLVTGVSHLAQEPDLGDPGTLSPTGTGPDGSSQLAELLTAQGVTVRRVTSSAQALAVLADADERSAYTVFVPGPNLLNPALFRSVSRAFGNHRLVLVRPGANAAYNAGFGAGRPRWAARTVSPGCATDFAVAAGPATVLRSRYAVNRVSVDFACYRGGLVGFSSGDSQIVAVGATDPFRNSRIGEVGNAALATALLGGHQEVIWVDVHERERVPKPPAEDIDYKQPERNGFGGSNPMWTAFPPVLWGSLALLLVLAILIATVKGRRLGPPVVEPLPVVVPATETVIGRGRLYARIRSRTESLATLRDAALRRIARLVDPPGGVVVSGADHPPDHDLITQVATRTGIPDWQVREILHGPAPETDEQLIHAVAQLDALVEAVLRVGSRPTDARGPVNPGERL